jgi:hypothetical protein
MAQLGVQYPSLEGLGGIFEGMGTSQRFNIAKQNEGINQQQALQDIYQNEQMNPLRVRQALLGNQTTEAQLPGVVADSSRKTRDNQVREGIPLDVEQRAKLSEIAAKMSEDEWKQEEAAIQKALVHPSAAVRAQAQKMLPLLKEFQKSAMEQSQKSADAQALETLRGTNAQALMKQQIDAGRFKKSGSGAVTFMEQFGKLKNSKDKHAALVLEAKKAELDGDEELAARYTAMAESIRAQATAEIATPKPGSVDVPSVAPNIRTHQQPNIAPPGAKAPAAGPQGDVEVFKKAFGAYEPDKYEYRIGPTGVPQRRKK